MAYVPPVFISHTRRVQTLYKKFLRDIENWQYFRHDVRIQSVLVREAFDNNRNIRDPVAAKKALEAGETYYEYIKHPEQIKFSTSFGGVAWEREEINHYDPVLDYWHPLEKAVYPDYFARREQRKKEFVEWYDKKYGRPKFEER